MSSYTTTIDADVMDVLQRSTLTETSVTLPPGQLDRGLYVRVNKVLEAAGGKWTRSLKAHVFSRDPREALGLAMTSGAITDQRKARQQFFTPPDLARYVVAQADIRPGMLVLEPSAGDGAIARVIRDETEGVVTCIELDESLRAGLMAEGFEVGIARDFLSTARMALYDRVVMNPPFMKGQDVQHVEHAFGCLKPGGLLVAIMPSGVRHRTDKRTFAFRQMLEAHGATIEDLPDGSFEESGTGVNTVLVTWRKPD